MSSPDLNQQAIAAWESLIAGERNSAQAEVAFIRQNAKLDTTIATLEQSLNGLMTTVDSVIEHTSSKPLKTKRRKTASKKTS